MPTPSLPSQRLQVEHYIQLLDHLLSKLTDPQALLYIEQYKLQLEQRLRAIELELIQRERNRHGARRA